MQHPFYLQVEQSEAEQVLQLFPELTPPEEKAKLEMRRCALRLPQWGQAVPFFLSLVLTRSSNSFLHFWHLYS